MSVRPRQKMIEGIADTPELRIEPLHQPPGGVELLEPALQLHFGADVRQDGGTDVGAGPAQRVGGALEGTGVAHLDYPGQLAATELGLREILMDDLAEHRPFPVVEAAQQFELRRVERIGRPVL